MPNWRWTEAGGRPVRVLDTGPSSAGGPTLVLVPGLGAVGYLAPLAEQCARWARVLLLDVPGFGHPSTSSCPAALGDVAGVVRDVLDEAVAGPVVLSGHSTGAQAALRVAIERPQRTTALVLLGPTFPPALRRWPALAVAAAGTVAGEGRRMRLAARTVPAYLRAGRGVAELLRSCLDDAPEEHIADLACPLLLVRGRLDGVSPAGWAATLVHAAPRAHALTLPGSHNMVLEHAPLVSRVLREALDAVCEGSADRPDQR